jgi:hypothetical protein
MRLGQFSDVSQNRILTLAPSVWQRSTALSVDRANTPPGVAPLVGPNAYTRRGRDKDGPWRATAAPTFSFPGVW